MRDVPWSVWTGKDGMSTPMRHSQLGSLHEDKSRVKQIVIILCKKTIPYHVQDTRHLVAWFACPRATAVLMCRSLNKTFTFESSVPLARTHPYLRQQITS